MPTEKQLLNTIFDDATSDNERATAVAWLKKLLGKDRSDLVAKYTSAGSSASALPDDDEPFDLDACLAEYGLDRARVDADFANHVTNEKKQAPDVAQLKSMLEGHRKLLAMEQEMAASVQADLARSVKIERGLEEELILEKFKHLQRVARGEVGKAEKPKGRKQSAVVA
jgi:hypothetical protein